MIAYLEGMIMEVQADHCILLVQGVGYRIHPVGMFLQKGQNIEVRIYDHIREDRRELFAFENEDVSALFQQLIGISGIGPKLAQTLLSHGDHTAFTKAILDGDVQYLVAMPGVGKKTAQKIILELKGVLVLEPAEHVVVDEDVIDALMSLGYRRKDCLEIVKDLQGETPEERIRYALRLLGR
jgi:holliday junction DNA helicase RuvA